MQYEGIGDRYQALTKYARNAMPFHRLDWSKQPSLKKTYPESVRTVPLPEATITGGPPVWEVIRARRSLRSFSSESISIQELSQLIWATQGTTFKVRDHRFRAAPSAGALYPVETYLCVNRVGELGPGIYHYDAVDGFLHLLKKGEYGGEAAAAALDQPMVAAAAVVFIWTAIIERSKWKYKERAYRYIYMDAGHIGQNLYLAATALGLGCCTIGALYDGEVNELLGVDGEEETAIYMCTIGRVSM